MWKKSDNKYPEPLNVGSLPNIPIGNRDQAVIGPSITIKGDLSGEEDLVIQGRVEGTIHVKQFDVTVGKNGRIKADIYAKSIKVEGEVHGNLYGQEQIVIRKTGHVQGNISAPNVALEEGCRFKGSVDMESHAAAKESGTQANAPQKQDKRQGQGQAQKDKAKSDADSSKTRPVV